MENIQPNWKHLMTKFRMSHVYIAISAIQVLVSIVVLVYIVIDPSQNMHQSWIVVTEFLLTISIFCDIVLRLVLEGERFIRDKWNLIDVGAFTLIVILLSIFYVINSNAELIEIDDLLGLVLIIIRYLIQIMRIIIVIKQYLCQINILCPIKLIKLDKQMIFDSNMLINKLKRYLMKAQIFLGQNYHKHNEQKQYIIIIIMQIIKKTNQSSHQRNHSTDKLGTLNTQRSNTIYPSSSRSFKLKSTKSFTQPLTKRKPTESEQFDDIIKTPFDEEIFKFKHKCSAPQHLRLEQIYRFIYEKKIRNKQKYSMSSKINQQALPVPSGSISIMLNVARKDYGFNLQSFKKKIAPKSKFKMKWKTIQWLLKNRKDAIRQIFQNYQTLVKFIKNKKEGLDKEEFSELLSYVGLGADKNLAEKLFYVFDEDSSGTVDYKELIVGLEVLKDDTIEEKLKIFFDLCDEDGSGKVSEKEIFGILKQNVINENDKYQLKQTIREMIRQVDQDGDGELNKDEILMAASKNQILRRILEQTISNVKRIDQIIQNDLEEPFHQFVPSSANFVQSKEGVHFPTQDNLIDALREMEKVNEKVKQIKEWGRPHHIQGVTTYQGLQEKKYLDDDDEFV